MNQLDALDDRPIPRLSPSDALRETVKVRALRQLRVSRANEGYGVEGSDGARAQTRVLPSLLRVHLAGSVPKLAPLSPKRPGVAGETLAMPEACVLATGISAYAVAAATTTAQLLSRL